MRILKSASDFRMRHSSYQAGRWGLSTLSHGTGVEHVADPLGFPLIARVLSGRIQRWTGGQLVEAGPGDVFLIARPDRPYTVRWDTVVMDMVRLDTPMLSAVSGVLPHRDIAELLRTDGCLPPAASATWARAVGYAGQVLADPDAAGSPLVVASLARHLAALVVDGLAPGSKVTSTGRDRRDAHRATLRRAMTFIEDYPDRDIGLDDIAAAAHASPRSVQLAFRHHLQTTPMTYLRRIRLARAHADLVAAVPTEDTVTTVALRWGFSNVSRFIGQYRLVYGTSPGQALKSTS